MPLNHPYNVFQRVLSRSQRGLALDRSDLAVLLSVRGDQQREALFAAARSVRNQHFGQGIFLYGFVYTSTYCRNDCTFCYYRRANTLLPRYRKDAADILAAARHLAEAGVHLIDLTMGEDPDLYTEGTRGFDALAALVAEVRAATGLPVMISPGALPDRALSILAAAGATWYACYQETHTPELFNRLRIRQSFVERMHKKRLARAMGFLVEEGVLCGIGETDADLVESIVQMRILDADQVRAMTFVPQQDTPLKDIPAGADMRELITLAVMRLAFPDRLIPASLDVRGLDGLPDRLRAGANVVTSIVPPGRGLAGVANSSLDIESSRRTCARVKRILAEEGLQTADREDYLRWVAARKEAIANDSMGGRAECP
jgi:methylornithine synthase